MNNLKFKHSIPVQLRFNDADSLGHINNSVYFSFYDLGKSGYFKTVKENNTELKEAEVVIAHVEVDFFASVFLSDEIEVQTATLEIGNKSLTLIQRIFEPKTDAVKCICKTVLVSVDFDTQKSVPISDDWRKAISEYEEKIF